MRKGQADLVSIIPALPLPASSMSTLGDLQMEGRKEPRNRFKPLHMHPRPLSSGSFLDYGLHTSFAPAFDSEGAEVGRDGLGQMLMGRVAKRKVKEARRKLIAKLHAEQVDDMRIADATDAEVPQMQDREAIDELLRSLFPDDKVDGFKAALQQLEVEEGVASLLEKNARALERLNILQTVRLRAGGSPVKVDSEEWKIGAYGNFHKEAFLTLALFSPRDHELPHATYLVATPIIDVNHRPCKFSTASPPTSFGYARAPRYSSRRSDPWLARHSG